MADEPVPFRLDGLFRKIGRGPSDEWRLSASGWAPNGEEEWADSDDRIAMEAMAVAPTAENLACVTRATTDMEGFGDWRQALEDQRVAIMEALIASTVPRVELARVIAEGLAGGDGSDAIAGRVLRAFGGRRLATVEEPGR